MMVARTNKYNYIDCDPELCIGCQICEYVCSHTKTGDYNSYRSRIRTVRVDEILITAIACRTCEGAACVVACPQDALSQDPVSGVIRVDAAKCDACAWCVEACEFGAISINPANRLAEICDQCEDQEDGPQCVLWCPKEALALTTSEQRAQKSRKELIKQEVIAPRLKEELKK
jgi:anaerobic carbon-monoxide dehydrogenase iron sulfur subunit